jgi:tetratricopeptide (TPR) repeat protein
LKIEEVPRRIGSLLIFCWASFALWCCTSPNTQHSEAIRKVQVENEYSDDIRLKAMAEAILADPNNPIPWAKRADLYIKQSDFVLAIADAKQALKLDTTRGDSYTLLAAAYRGNRTLDSAAMCIQKAKRLGYASPNLLVISGEILLIARRYEDALAELNDALKLAPDNAKALFYKGLVLEGLGDTTRAIASITKAVNVDPEFADGHNKLATVYMRRGNDAFALQHLKSGLRFAPSDAYVHFNMGVYFQRKQMPDSARVYFAKAVFFEPSMYLANYELGMYSHRQKNYLEAANRLEAALQYAPKMVEARFFLALSREFLGSYAEAAEQYRVVINQNKGYVTDSKAGLARLQAKLQKIRQQENQDLLSDTAI